MRVMALPARESVLMKPHTDVWDRKDFFLSSQKGCSRSFAGTKSGDVLYGCYADKADVELKNFADAARLRSRSAFSVAMQRASPQQPITGADAAQNDTVHS